METKLLKTTQLLVFIYVIFFFAGCSKNTIILEVGDENKPSGGNNTEGTNLVTFNASIEGRNLMTRAMSPMNQGIKSKVLVFEPSTQNGTKGTPSAQGLYITSAPGVLTGVDGYKMYLGNGIFDFYAVSDNFSTIPPTFSAGKSEPLFNGIDYLWWHNPNLDVARDARWGRIGETFGEDTYLVTQMGTSLIYGLQGRYGVEPERVLACAKHLIGGGEPMGGINAAPMDMSEQKLREVFLPPFISAVQSNVFTVMAAHNELNGIPCHGNYWLLNDLLRDEIGFKGFIVSDWMDIERMYSMHHYLPSEEEAFRVSVEAGIDMHMQGDKFFETILTAVRDGHISEVRIDKAVHKILEAKFLLGLFENPVVDIPGTRALIAPSKHRQTALEAARQSLVLLKTTGCFP